MVGDPPRKMVTRYLRWFASRRVSIDYLALYHMNIATEAQRTAFMDRVHTAMSRF